MAGATGVSTADRGPPLARARVRERCVGLPVEGSKIFSDYIFNELEKLLGGKWAVEPDTGKMAARIIDHINKKRQNLGISKGKKRVLYDMEMRRELKV